MSTISGQINGARRTKMNATSWLHTDEIQFLFAFLLRNQHDTRGVFHVLGPMITHKLSLVCEVMPAVNSESATVEQQRTYEANMQGIQDYIESRLDILQHKFLVFVCNINNIHWVSVVVVNPFLISDQYLAGGKQNKKQLSMAEQKKDTSEDFVGYCVLNSTQRPGETNARGFQGTYHTKYDDAAYGVRLFLNICASYLKAKRKFQGTIELEYEEPFGEWQESRSSEEIK
jgi:hypothetical protein